MLQEGLYNEKLNCQLHIKTTEGRKKELFSLAKNKLGYDYFSQFINALPSLFSEFNFIRRLDNFMDLFKDEMDKKFPMKQWKILHYLYCRKGSGYSGRELADKLGKIPPQIALDIENLLNRRFILTERKKDVTVYKLTVKGLSVAESIFSVFVAFNLDSRIDHTAQDEPLIQ